MRGAAAVASGGRRRGATERRQRTGNLRGKPGAHGRRTDAAGAVRASAAIPTVSPEAELGTISAAHAATLMQPPARRSLRRRPSASVYIRRQSTPLANSLSLRGPAAMKQEAKPTPNSAAELLALPLQVLSCPIPRHGAARTAARAARANRARTWALLGEHPPAPVPVFAQAWAMGALWRLDSASGALTCRPPCSARPRAGRCPTRGR